MGSDAASNQKGSRALPIVLAAWTLAPIVAVGVLTYFSASSTVTGSQTPVTVEVSDSAESSTVLIDLGLTWTEPAPLVAPSWSGIVQSVEATAGEEIMDGSVIATIDGIQRTAVATPGPLYRPIEKGTSGVDVLWLNEALARHRMDHAEGQVATSKTAAGIRQWASKIGATADGVFDPGWVIFLPGPDFSAASINLTIGAPAPTAGSAIVDASRKLTSASLVARGSLDAFLSQTGVGATEPTLDPQTIDARAQAAPEDAQLWVDKQELSLSESRTQVSGEELAYLAGLTNSEVLQARLVRPAADDEVRLPAAAVFAGDSGATCVLVVGADSIKSVPVTVISDEQGETSVRGRLKPGDRVIVGPRGSTRQCNS